MYRKLNDIDFPEGIKTIFVNGRLYTKKQFNDAKKRDKFRDGGGRFKKHPVSRA